MDLNFKKLAFQKNKLQLIWTSFDASNQLLNSNYPGYSFGIVCTRYCFSYFQIKRYPNCAITFWLVQLGCLVYLLC